MEILFFTNNKRKANGMKKIIEKFRINIKIEKNFGIPEIQADTCEEVAEFGAKWTAEKIRKPTIKLDTGLFVDALNGLPGVYTSQFHKKLGIEKFMKLMENETNRKAYLVYAFSFCEPGKEPVTFSCKTKGTVIEKSNQEGSLIDSVFIPDGEKEVIGKLRETHPEKISQFFDIEEKFAKWFIKNNKI